MWEPASLAGEQGFHVALQVGTWSCTEEVEAGEMSGALWAVVRGFGYILSARGNLGCWGEKTYFAINLSLWKS